MRKIEIILLSLIILSACILRLYRFQQPIADWHSWRQVDTSSVSRSFVEKGIDLLHPTYHDLSNGVSLLDNPKGYRFVEFPFYNTLQAGGYKLFNYFTLEQWGRLVTILSSLISIVFLFLLAKRYLSERAAFIAAFLYAVLPYNIYYGRVILSDPLMVSFFLGGLYFYDKWIKKTQSNPLDFHFLISVVLTASAILIKPFVIFFFVPFVYLAFRRYGVGAVKQYSIWLFFILTILPFIAWRIWMNQYPQGIPRSDWLFNGSQIRFKGAFFWWIFAERISKLILGYWGLPLFIIGLIGKAKDYAWFMFSLIISVSLYLFIVATGNIQHDYYQILIMPVVVLFLAKGVDFILSYKDVFNRKISIIAIFVSIIFMLSFSWREIRAYYYINHPEIIEAGRAIDMLTPKDAKIIAIYKGDTTFLYHTKRSGWPVFERSLEEFIKAGATHIAFVNPTQEELGFGSLFQTITKTDTYVLFDLTKPLK